MPSKFTDNGVISKIVQKQILSAFIDKNVLANCGKQCKLQYVFVSDEALLQMNQTYLQHDTFTDIITFDLSEKHTTILGEIYISIDRINENATQFKVDYLQELHRIIFHGALHLCGYADKTPKAKKEMTIMEDKWLADWNKQIKVKA
jgi:probable rRNA maturation factor